MLKPNVTVPVRRKIAGPLLDEIFDIEQKKVTAETSGMNATIAIDGWSTIKNQPVIGVCIYVHGKCYLIETLICLHSKLERLCLK